MRAKVSSISPLQLDPLRPGRSLTARDRDHLSDIELRQLVTERRGTLRYGLVIIGRAAASRQHLNTDLRHPCHPSPG